MYELMAWLEASALAEFLRGLGVWTYGLVNLVHILGIGTLLGSVLLLDLRLLGAWNSIPLPTIARPTVPLAATGFVLAVCSGVAMLSFNTTEYHGNPFLYIKLPTLVVALANVAIIQRLSAWRRGMAGNASQPGDRGVLAVAGAVSLLLWLTVVACGRMIGYW
ncbi:DUF6644 family protein [Chromatocurvus halotolerans]|uniref:DUF6644 domain-containing protein n=1 Tax=Chromatocurvus halotolerans TaxID=1132028 RepID=A0A4R2KWB2_9GAMM|nr:DUF6644 family protein [Chromatocurvus halotolerans]TCO77137.1 hypothetical protein EV688_103151 [Chromatocurvus halotolerans]